MTSCCERAAERPVPLKSLLEASGLQVCFKSLQEPFTSLQELKKGLCLIQIHSFWQRTVYSVKYKNLKRVQKFLSSGCRQQTSRGINTLIKSCLPLSRPAEGPFPSAHALAAVGRPAQEALLGSLAQLYLLLDDSG